MFTLTIQTGNAAFEDGNRGVELARILRDIAADLEAGLSEGIQRDINGNKVARWRIED